MIRVSPGAFAVALVAIVTGLALPVGTAAADGLYFTESLGGTQVKDDLAMHIDGGLRLRAALGYRHEHLAFELWAAGLIGMTYKPLAAPEPICEPTASGKVYCHRPSPGPASTGFGAWGVDVKYLQPVASHVEVYLRGGLGRGYAGGLDAVGRGVGIGAGIQVKGKVSPAGLLFWPLFFLVRKGPMMTGALFIDSSYEFYRLHGVRKSTDAQLSHLTFGFALGKDF